MPTLDLSAHNGDSVGASGIDVPVEVLRQVEKCPECGRPIIHTPRLVCEHGTVMPIRCLYYRRGKYYYADCLDLDIVARGATLEAAIADLQEAMYGYLKVVASGPPSDGLVPRRAPRSRWIRFWMLNFRDYFFRLLLRPRTPHYRADDLRSFTVSNC